MRVTVMEMGESATFGSDRYSVTGTLGSGGMGAVYRATDLQSGATVALKRLHVDSDAARNPDIVELFRHEFRILAQLAHPNVVSVYDFGEDAQGPYYTMELLDGEDLHALAPMPWRQACQLLHGVCSAAALLHSRRMLHRDLSPRNVRRTRDGRAKLIDFGAMAPMGLCRKLVGTPPLIPPEALLQQPLDARADVFGIGGTLYFALTGRHAYPARSVAHLRELWREPPPPPSAHAPDVPPELDRLVMTLLSLEPIARPASAAEVLDRIAVIASLPRDEQHSVSRAYLSTPELVGRAEALSIVRRRLAELHMGRGGVLLIEGAPGMGRSRMLDTCVLEAKLAGMLVARAIATDAAAHGNYGAVAALLQQLSEPFENVADAVATQVSHHADPENLLASGEISDQIEAARRPELHAALQALLERRARIQPVVLSVDDVELCDEPSLAALAAAATACHDERVLLVVSAEETDVEGEGPLALLLRRAQRIRLSAFTERETEALLGSIFGDAPYLHALAARIHERAEGSPRGCIELAQYLLDRGFIHYELGAWALPPTLDDAQLPRTLSVARRAKLDALSPPARELAEAVALADGHGLDIDAYAELTEHGDHARVQRAFDELLFAQILRREGARCVFGARVWLLELREALSPERVRVTYARLAPMLERRGCDRLEVAHNWFLAGESSLAIDTLIAELARGSRWDRAPRNYPDLLRRAECACLALGRARRDRLVLVRELVKVGQDLALPDLRERTIGLIAELRRDSGLDDWDCASHVADPAVRLQQAYAAAEARHAQASERDRGFAPAEAIEALVRVVAETAAVAAQTGDATLFDILPSLAAFVPLSREIDLVENLRIPAARDVVAGRYEQARDRYLEAQKGLLDRNSKGPSSAIRDWAIRAIHYVAGCIEAALGRERALHHAEELERAPGWLVPAYSVRQIYHLTLGNLGEAEHERRQIELQLLQSTVKPPLSAGSVHQHLYIYVLTDNLKAMRHVIPELERLAVSNPGLRPFVPFARAEHARICGNFEDALTFITQAGAQVRPGEHPLWPWVMWSWQYILLGLGQYAPARELGLQAVATAGRIGLRMMRAHIEVPLAIVEAKLGDFESACERFDRGIELREREGFQGVALGWIYEARARIALWMNDGEGFERYAEKCAKQYDLSEGEPALAAKLQRLIAEGRTRGLEPRADGDVASDAALTRSNGTTPEQTIGPALAACSSRAQRIEYALKLLIERAGAMDGELFLIDGDALALVATSTPGLGADARLPALARLLELSGEDCTVTGALSLQGPILPDGSQSSVWPMLLATSQGAESALVGVVALHFAPNAPVHLPLATAVAVAKALIDTADVVARVVDRSAPQLED